MDEKTSKSEGLGSGPKEGTRPIDIIADHIDKYLTHFLREKVSVLVREDPIMRGSLRTLIDEHLEDTLSGLEDSIASRVTEGLDLTVADAVDERLDDKIESSVEAEVQSQLDALDVPDRDAVREIADDACDEHEIDLDAIANRVVLQIAETLRGSV